jgi:hypothetical protein
MWQFRFKYCHALLVTIRRRLDWMIESIEILKTVAAINYNHFNECRILKITAAPANPFPASCIHQPFPRNRFNSLALITV